ncbi:dienelactone hydrolase family protein [Abditibacterium utsteinense]|nr:dienelactone hydrolase family protein [Abditibacterium utsteinense]
MKLSLLSGAILLATCAVSGVPAHARIITKTVDYKQGETVLQGYLAYDDLFKGKRPGILVAHQWKGLGEYEKRRARMLAQMGYVAFALDIYGKDVRPKDAKEAGAQAGKYRADRPLLRERARAAVIELRKEPLVDENKLAIIGYCFGGGTALELARSGADLRGFVSFHGNLDTPDASLAKNIKGKILVLHGAIDPNVKPESIVAFHDEMEAARVDYQFIAYSGAVHSFTEREAGNDISKGSAYNEKADRRSWQAMKDFFTEIFGS